MRQVPWISGFCVKRSQFFSFCSIQRSPVTTRPHGAYRNSEPEQVHSGKDYWSRFAADFFCNWKIWKQLSEYSYRKWMAASLFYKYRGILLWADILFKMLLKCKASMPLLVNFIFRNGRRFCLRVIIHPDRFWKACLRKCQNDTLKSMFRGCNISKI